MLRRFLADTPVHSEFFERAFLHFHKLRLDLDLPNIAVTNEDVSNPLEITGGLRDDQRRTIVRQTCSRHGVELDAGLLQERLDGLAFASARSRGRF
jgi:hypothetical protein